MAEYVLGISSFYHDSAACLVRGGEIIGAAQEERFTRKKHDPGFPVHAIRYCLKQGGIQLSQVDYIVFYDKPLLKFERLLETYLAFAPRGFKSFLAAMPVWIKEKLFLKSLLRRELASLDESLKSSTVPPIFFTEHHESHAASAFFASPYPEAAILCMDGVGEWATTSAWHGKQNQLTPIWEIPFPHSVGLLYSAFTYYTGFKVNSGEYKVMGLAPYGKPKYVQSVYEHLIDLKPDGSFRLNMEYFDYCTGLTMTNEKFHKLFGGSPRKPEAPLTQREMDLASSIQAVTEEIVLRLARTVHRNIQSENLCLAGGVALNCVANGRLLREGPFKNIWVQPAAGDAGGALGAAMAFWHQYLNQPRVISEGRDSMQGGFLGPEFSDEEIKEALDRAGASYLEMTDDSMVQRIAEDLASGKVVGWMQGRMEFGPRSLGARSILGDARNTEMQSTMNMKIKYRESFRPFAPAVLREEVGEYFEMNSDSPYMLMAAPVAAKHCKQSEDGANLWGIDLLKVSRSDIPAVTHVDYSARVQTVASDVNPRFYKLLEAFKNKTGCPVVVNTSFNVRGEPIVCTPEDAYRCFMRTEMDVLIMGHFVLDKTMQAKLEVDSDWRKEFALD